MVPFWCASNSIFAADALSSFNDLINLFQAARTLFPDLADSPRYFFIDEATSVPDWQRGMKWVRDNTTAASDCVVATGSSARDIASGTSDLAGRRGPDVGLDRLLMPLSFAEFARCAGYALPIPPRIPFDAFYAQDGRDACQDALVYAGTLYDAFETYLLIGGFPHAEVDFVVLPDSRAAESKYVDEAARGEARAMVANFGGGLLLTRSAIDLRPDVTIVPASIFAWLLVQRG